MSGERICAAPGCTNEVLRRPGAQGRPPIYCSLQCRPSKKPNVLAVDVELDEDSADPGRDWVVRLRRGNRAVVVGRGLGRFSAAVLAAELRVVVGAHPS
jgi:hypothetical protein